MTFKIRPYLRDNYPCPVSEGGCGAGTGVACRSQAGNPTQPHTPRWKAHQRATSGGELYAPARPAIRVSDRRGELDLLMDASRHIEQARRSLDSLLQLLQDSP